MSEFIIQGTRIWLQADEITNEQIIHLEASPMGETLAKFLANAEKVTCDGVTYQVVHTPVVDDLILELIDALVAIRYQHPHYVQLQINLPGVAV